MNKVSRLAHTLLLSSALITGQAHSASTTPGNSLNEVLNMTPKAQVVALLKSIESGDPAPVAVINPNQYTQHNLGVADGLSGFGQLLQSLPPNSAKVDTVRVFQDGDYVFAHTDYSFFGPKVGFDIFRFEHGRIVEHWDNLQTKPNTTNPSGRTMLDGPTQASSPDQTQANKTLVKSFISDVLIDGKLDQIEQYLDADNYRQHNPQIGDNLSGLSQALQAMADQGVTMEYQQIHLLLGEGNFVLAASEGTLGGKPTAYYDLFRVESGKIVEHWDTIETIPPREHWLNDNGKF